MHQHNVCIEIELVTDVCDVDINLLLHVLRREFDPRHEFEPMSRPRRGFALTSVFLGGKRKFELRTRAVCIVSSD